MSKLVRLFQELSRKNKHLKTLLIYSKTRRDHCLLTEAVANVSLHDLKKGDKCLLIATVVNI